ncbi:Os02g0238500, partial [Oryza sativa Japonica Group]
IRPVSSPAALDSRLLACPAAGILLAEVALAFSCSRRIRSPVSILIHPIRPRPRVSSPRLPLAPIPILRGEVAPGVLLLPPHRRSPAKLKPLLSRANLLIARDIEWANIMLAFEQESRYIIMDPLFPQSPVGFIREKSNVIFRQLFRSRRPFVAEITDAMGNEIFTVRRPFWLINSSIYAEVNGKEVGVVHRRWHLWRRIYDLYLGNRQFAVVENPGFWNWTFTLTDEDDNVLAQIDRNWRGIGFELFTDAGQYAIRFGDAGLNRKFGLASDIDELHVVRQLTLPERAVALALAVSLDCDYFSRRGGW